MMNELQQLKDIHLPQAISNWPIAPGWLFLWVSILMLMIYIINRWYKSRQKKLAIRFALAKLKYLEQCMTNPEKQMNIAAEISILIRRTALYYFRREEVASLSGKQWLDFLDQSGQTNHFSQAGGYLLTELPYQKEITSDLKPLFAMTRAWLVTLAKKVK